jgi:hypothetical protein
MTLQILLSRGPLYFCSLKKKSNVRFWVPRGVCVTIELSPQSHSPLPRELNPEGSRLDGVRHARAVFMLPVKNLVRRPNACGSILSIDVQIKSCTDSRYSFHTKRTEKSFSMERNLGNIPVSLVDKISTLPAKKCCSHS